MAIEARRSYGNRVNGETSSDMRINPLASVPIRCLCTKSSRAEYVMPSRSSSAEWPLSILHAIDVCQGGARGWGGGHLTSLAEVLENMGGIRRG